MGLQFQKQIEAGDCVLRVLFDRSALYDAAMNKNAEYQNARRPTSPQEFNGTKMQKKKYLFHIVPALLI